ncbi:MAG TPA: class I SAM-dependent methyltransferase [Solirubrobacteraceae bacterium]|nr:class I SAM-dependent methyltransferase [Solirubrobacteraceae bacterium]
MRVRRRTVASTASRLLPRIASGKLTALPVALRFWDGSVLPAAPGARQPHATVAVSRQAIAHLIYTPGQLGLARAWVDGSLAIEGDLEAVISSRNEFDGVRLSPRDIARVVLAATSAGGPAVLRRPPIPSIEADVHGERHSEQRDGQAVRHHYDVSNDFYRMVLGPSMMYSCAYFSEPTDSLEHAQERKLDLICRKLMLSPGQRFLDIGCGWGSLVLHAAEHYGVDGYGVTLSELQARYARERAAELGLDRQARFEVADYRELSGRSFDRISSVGMFEHVGQTQLGEYFTRIWRMLKPGGLLLNHGISRLKPHPPQTDAFIARYIFPDGELMPLAEVVAAVQAGGLEPRDVESLRDHYPPTLRAWLANLRAHGDEATALVGAQRVRAWELYILASALGFEDGDITVYQVLAARDRSHGLPFDRLQLLEPQRDPAIA